MKLRIKECNDPMKWYASRINEVFNVEAITNDFFLVKDYGDIYLLIDRDHVEVIC